MTDTSKFKDPHHPEHEHLIELDGVCYAYEGLIALRYVTFNVHRGEVIALEGANGTGKSTLLRLLNGLIYPEEGTYRFEGHEISRETMKDIRFSKWFHQKIGFIFQNSDVQLFCSNVEEEIAFGPLQMGLSDEEVAQRVRDILRLLDIEKLKNRAPYHLSGGEKKKVALACVLSMNPEILMLDEPLAGLDRASQEWLTNFLVTLKKSGRTMVIATHNENLAERLADRHIFFNENHETEEKRVIYHTHRHMHILDEGDTELEDAHSHTHHHHHPEAELEAEYAKEYRSDV